MEKKEKMEKMKDFLYEITATAEVSHDHLEDWFDEKSSVTNTLLVLWDNGDRVMQLIEKNEKDKKTIIKEMIKFFHDAYSRTVIILARSHELMDVKNKMAVTAGDCFWEIKETALSAIRTCESRRRKFVNKS